MLLSLLIALPGVLFRWVFLRRAVQRSTGAIAAGLVWLVLVSLYFYGGGEQTPIFTGVGAILLYLALTAPKKDDISHLHNALVAEHSLSLIELTPENPTAKQLKEAVVKTYRVSGFPNYSEDAVAKSFNALSRIEQLNLLAMAFNEMGLQPILRKERWMPVKDPFVDKIDDKLVESVTKRLSDKHAAPIGLSQGRFAIKDWGVADMRSVAASSTTRQAASSNVYELPGHKARLVDNPQLPGPIEYLYALYVSRSIDNEPKFIVTAEKQFSMPGIEDALKDSEYFSDVDMGELSGGVVIGIHSDHGHENHGASPEYADRNRFIAKALQLAKEKISASLDG